LWTIQKPESRYGYRPVGLSKFYRWHWRLQKIKIASELIEAEGAQLRVLSLDALIRTKKAMKHPRDKQAILELEAIKELKNPQRDWH